MPVTPSPACGVFLRNAKLRGGGCGSFCITHGTRKSAGKCIRVCLCSAVICHVCSKSEDHNAYLMVHWCTRIQSTQVEIMRRQHSSTSNAHHNGPSITVLVKSPSTQHHSSSGATVPGHSVPASPNTGPRHLPQQLSKDTTAVSLHHSGPSAQELASTGLATATQTGAPAPGPGVGKRNSIKDTLNLSAIATQAAGLKQAQTKMMRLVVRDLSVLISMHSQMIFDVTFAICAHDAIVRYSWYTVRYSDATAAQIAIRLPWKTLRQKCLVR